mgnify:CR=1 FL=1|jgi:hypothetical protein
MAGLENLKGLGASLPKGGGGKKADPKEGDSDGDDVDVRPHHRPRISRGPSTASSCLPEPYVAPLGDT